LVLYTKYFRGKILQKKKLFLFLMIAVAIFLPSVHTNVYASDTVVNTTPMSITLQNATDISIDMDNLYIIDTAGNGALLTISLAHPSSTQTNFVDSSDQSIIIPGHLSANYSPNAIVTGQNVVSIHSVSPTDQSITTLSNKYFDTSNSLVSSSFGTILDVCTTLNGDIYVLDSNGIIAKKNYNETKFIRYYDLALSSIVPNDTTKMSVSLDSSIVLLAHDNTIYNVGNTSMNITNFDLPTTTNIRAMLLDHHNQLYVLDDTCLIRSNTSNHHSIDLGSDFTNTINFCIDYNSGTGYFLTPTTCISTSITFEGNNFFHTLNEQSSNINISTFTPTQALRTLTPNQDNITLYEFPSFISKLDTLSREQNMILLDDTDANFYYVLINNLNNSNTLGYVKKSDAIINPTSTTTISYRLLLDNTPIYTLPTSLNIGSTPRITCTLDKYTNGEYTILNSIISSNLPTDSNNITFVPVSFTYNDTTMFGYVDSHRIITINSRNLSPTFVTNATTRQDITVYADDSLSTQYISLPKDTNVYVVQTTNDICLIEWMENDVLKSGYVSHRYINDGTLSHAQLVGLIAMFLALSLSIILIAIINKRRRRIKDVNDDE